MLTIIAFLLTILGNINWLMIGLLQYDFIAGIFGYQASIFSRIIYIIIGASSAFLLFKLIKGKGILPIWTKRNKKDVANNINKIKHKTLPSHKVEAGEELPLSKAQEAGQQQEIDSQPVGLFDEHFKDRENYE